MRTIITLNARWPMTELNITAEERREITAPAQGILSTARNFKITDDPSYRSASDALKAIKGAAKLLAAKKAPLLDPATAVVKAIRALFAGPEQELEEAERLYKRAMLGYQDEQERIRREQQRKLDEAAAAERRKLEEKAAKEREQAEAARAQGRDSRAAELERRADLRTDAAAAVVAPVVQVEAPRVAGVSTRENWSALVLDKSALIKAVAAGTVPELALEPNMKFLNAQAKVMKRELPYPGVKAVVEKVLASSSRPTGESLNGDD
jgi:hypothetical protein